ncbi:hypothetical protein [Hyalangium rubrum]|uniref:Pilus biogenesis operon protein n=1 Tax=Hyalangium rubrum TaxID=3103134 RepID=A0ABU5GYB6_9BACT|nr:hypothetical protein [Hyalangium sp. s54d21]MDY7226187.1 hypothetical protein [Hyalangium sp. s54d21]
MELALGLLVFITVLMFGIHFAEIGYLSLKVTEANASAMWHATAARMHELPGNFSHVNNLISGNRPGQAANGLYADFDGRTSKSGGSGSSQLFTRGQGLQVTCEAGGPSFAPVGTTDSVYSDTGGMVCRSEAVFQVLPVFPRGFMEGNGGFFKERHYEATDLTICGVNRGGSGGCQGQIGILLDDWALATRDELRECNVLDGSGCNNSPYYRSTNLVYDQHVATNGSARALAQQSVMSVPGGFDPATFYHSFRVFEDRENGGDSDPGNWVTTPGTDSPTTEYDSSYSARENCWLGLRCN